MRPPSINVLSDKPIFIRVAQRACEITNRITQIAKAFFASLVEFFLSPFRSSPVITPHVEASVVPEAPGCKEEPAGRVVAPPVEDLPVKDSDGEFEDAVETQEELLAASPQPLIGAHVDAVLVAEDSVDYTADFLRLFDTANHVATSSRSPVFAATAADLPSVAFAPVETEAQKKDRVEKALMMPQVKIDALKGFLTAGASCSNIATLAIELGKYAFGGNRAPFEDIVYFIQKNPDLHIHIQKIEKIISGAWFKDAIVSVINQFTPKLDKMLERFNSDTQDTTSTLKERFELCGIDEEKIRGLYTAFGNTDSKTCFQLLFPDIDFN